MTSLLIKLACFWLLTFQSTVFAKVSVSQLKDDIVYDIEIEGLQTNQKSIANEKFQEIRLLGVDEYAAIDYELGHPELPVIRMIVDGDVSVEVGSYTIEGVFERNIPVKPSQPSWNKSSASPPDLVFNSQSYSIDSFTQKPRFSIQDAGSYRGVVKKMVTINVLDYNPVRGHFRLLRDIKIKVKKGADKTLKSPVVALIIGQKFDGSPAVEKLKAIKASQGFFVKDFVVGVDIGNSSSAIRNALRSVYQEGQNLEFAILVGDVEDVASHPSDQIYGVTDHFYRCIDTDTYSTDINSPDIGVGRLSVSNDEELTRVVDKIERYFRGEFTSSHGIRQDDDWLRYPAFIATHDRYQVAEATHNFVISEYFAPAGYSREFPDNTGKGGDKLFPISLSATRQQILASLQKGRFIVNFSGHGSYSGWEDVSASDVLRLSHPSALPWVLSNSCITGDFRQEPVFAETWLRHRNGAIVFWGSMDSTYWDEDDILEKALYREVFSGRTKAFDFLHQKALQDVWRYYGGANRSRYYWETYVTFGDPSLDVRLDRAKEAVVSGPDRIKRGQTLGHWTVTVGGLPVKGANVVLMRNTDGLIVSGKTDEKGLVFLDLSLISDTESPIRQIVHSPDLRVFEQTIPIDYL